MFLRFQKQNRAATVFPEAAQAPKKEAGLYGRCPQCVKVNSGSKRGPFAKPDWRGAQFARRRCRGLAPKRRASAFAYNI